MTLCSATLDVSLSEERYFSENVSKHIQDLSSSWKLDGRIVAMVTDNARNMVNAVERLPYVHIGCSAHTLQLRVNQALKEAIIDSVLTKVRKIVGHVKHSAANFTEQKAIQEKHGEPKGAW